MAPKNPENRKGFTRKAWLEIATAGFTGAILSALTTKTITQHKTITPLAVITTPLVATLLTYALYELKALNQYRKDKHYGKVLLKPQPETLNIHGLPPIKWDNIQLALTTGNLHTHELKMGLSIPKTGITHQAHLHKHISRITTPLTKMRLSQNYLILIVNNTTKNFGENWKLGKIENILTPNNEWVSYILLTPTLFLRHQEYTPQLETIKTRLHETGSIYVHYHNSEYAADILEQWATYTANGITPTRTTLPAKYNEYINWFTNLTETQLTQLIQQIQNTPTNQIEKQQQVIHKATQELAKTHKNLMMNEKIYSNLIGLKTVDHILTLNPKNTKYAMAGATIIEAPAIAYVAGKHLKHQEKHILMNPIETIRTTN